MSRGPSGGWVDFEQTTYLVSGSTRTALAGPIVWEPSETTTMVGSVNVDAPVGSWENLRIEMRVSPLRPEHFTVAYVCHAGWVRRLCVNTEHRPISGTHKHRIVATAEDAYEPTDIPAVPESPNVPQGTYEKVFQAFVAECSIVVPTSFHWQSPWEGA